MVAPFRRPAPFGMLSTHSNSQAHRLLKMQLCDPLEASPPRFIDTEFCERLN